MSIVYLLIMVIGYYYEDYLFQHTSVCCVTFKELFKYKNTQFCWKIEQNQQINVIETEMYSIKLWLFCNRLSE